MTDRLTEDEVAEIRAREKRTRNRFGDETEIVWRPSDIAPAIVDRERLLSDRAAMQRESAERDEEIARLRAALDSQCDEHASNCCVSWCKKCQEGRLSLSALGDRNGE